MKRATTMAAGFLLLLALMPASSANAGETISSLPSDAEAAALHLTCTDKITTETTYTVRCGGGGSGGSGGGGGGGGGGGDPINPQDLIDAWAEFLREIIEDVIGEPDPDPVVGLDDMDQFLPRGGQTTSICHPTMFVCAMAGADSHIDDIGSAPDMAVMMALGHGSSQNPVFSVDVKVETNLGTGSCSAPPNQGCGFTFSDIRHGGNCYGTNSKTTATSGFPVATAAADPVCNKV